MYTILEIIIWNGDAGMIGFLLRWQPAILFHSVNWRNLLLKFQYFQEQDCTSPPFLSKNNMHLAFLIESAMQDTLDIVNLYLKVHKNENFFSFDFEICTFS